MSINVFYGEDPVFVLAEARDFLTSEPVQHNLILSLLHQRVEKYEPGRYWVARHGYQVAGVVFQSPIDFFATVTPMAGDVVSAVVDTVVDSGVVLPGVSGEAATAAKFAGQWTERTNSAAVPQQGLRIYEAQQLRKPTGVNGHMRRAGLADRDLVIDWLRSFNEEIGQPGKDPAPSVDRRLPAGMYKIWDDGKPVSLAGHANPLAGVVRIRVVYTPPAHRRHGYAGACVAELTEQIRERGYRSILYTDLGNPVSNSIYRRIGYRATAENLLYRFD